MSPSLLALQAGAPPAFPFAQARFAAAAVEEAGAPQALWTEIMSPAGSGELQIDVVWEKKTPTRLPETFWVR